MKFMKKLSLIPVLLLLLLIPAICFAGSSNTQRGNNWNQSFNKAKRTLERQVYFDHRETIYCGAEFTADKQVIPPQGFSTSKYSKRAKRIEWEHVVPAENFGRSFTEWRDGDSRCVDKRGKSFKGRKCAEKVNTEYRYMQSDLYNLYPAIGAVNAMRQNYNFTMLPDIENSKAEPPVESRGRIARTYKYMEWAYPRYKMSKPQRKLMDAWDKMYPTSQWECVRAKRIQQIQGSKNPFVVCQ
jgi:deoxyribonuclease-1